MGQISCSSVSYAKAWKDQLYEIERHSSSFLGSKERTKIQTDDYITLSATYDITITPYEEKNTIRRVLNSKTYRDLSFACPNSKIPSFQQLRGTESKTISRTDTFQNICELQEHFPCFYGNASGREICWSYDKRTWMLYQYYTSDKQSFNSTNNQSPQYYYSPKRFTSSMHDCLLQQNRLKGEEAYVCSCLIGKIRK